jgi:AAA domain
MSEPSPARPYYDLQTNRYARLWEDDGTSLEILHPQRDVFRRLKAEVIAKAKHGQFLLARAVIDLLSEPDRVRFHQNAQARAASLKSDGEHLALIDWYARLLEALDTIRRTQDGEDGAEAPHGGSSENPWPLAKDAPTWLAEPEEEFEGLAKDLLAPGAITEMASPRGLGKTQVSLALAVALATGGLFRGERVKPVRVLLLDRDNPETVVKRRLRAWGAAAAKNLRVLTRQNAPALQDKSAWDQFPLMDYDVLIVDSVGASTEGITEKEGKQTTEVLATILDLARKGLAILLLQNVTKDGLNFKGRGEWADRADILYEVRDATGFTPTGKKSWWLELPPAGEAAWGERAARRKSRVDFRLAFIPSKFRLGVEPEPFCLELRLPPDAPWTLDDVTEQLFMAGEEVRREAEQAKQRQIEQAAQALASAVAERASTNHPILKTEAETFLRAEDLTRREARQTIDDYDGRLWTVEKLPGKGPLKR